MCVLFVLQVKRLQESEDAAAEDEDSYEGLPEGIELRACPRCKVKIEKNDGCSAMTCYRCGEGFTWAAATLIKAKPRKPTTTLRLAALAATSWVSDSAPALRGLSFAVADDGLVTVNGAASLPDLTVPPAGCTVAETAAKREGRWTVARSDGWCVDESSTAELIVWRKEGSLHDRHTWKMVSSFFRID
jgi:hypothetical protein